jgi:hypothetical protein
MCWNAEVSLNTFIFSLFAALFALYNNVVTLPNALFYISFSSMQLIEYFVWKNINNKKANTFLSKIGLALILLQTLLSIFRISDSNHRNFMIYIYLACVVIVLTIIKPFNTIDFSTTKASNGHLAWNWLKFPLIILALFLFFQAYAHFYNKDYVTFSAFLVLVSLIYYTYRETGTWGSLWCWIANILGLVYIYKVFSKSLCK